MTTKVGILLVHGIGEQRRFQHLENEVRNIASALRDAPDTERVRVAVHGSRTAAYAAEQQTWEADEAAPVFIEVTDKANAVTELHFHEVWWADLDEPATFWVRLRFWLWGLSMWSLRAYAQNRQPGYERNRMRLPADGKGTSVGISCSGRLRLFAVGMIFLLILLTVSLLNLLARRLLGVELPGPEVLVNYVGDVKLYQQEGRSGKGPLVGLGDWPRVTLRRRMVRALVQMAGEGYDRWYVLAHSQGTVLAFNGLMETADSLPNYLDRAQWDSARQNDFAGTAPPLTDDEAKKMMPRRPAWLDPSDTIDRGALFEKLHGFMTYGSPLDKFAALWPAIVPMNGDESVFRPDFEWINVHDPTDPVADALEYFRPVKNLSYKAAGVHLWSHIEYLSFAPGQDDRLVNKVAAWIVKGGAFPMPTAASWRWPSDGQTRLYGFSRFFMWGLLGLVLAGILGFWFGELIDAIGKGVKVVPVVGDAVGGLLEGLVVRFEAWITAASAAAGVASWVMRGLFAIVGVALVVLVAGLGRVVRDRPGG